MRAKITLLITFCWMGALAGNPDSLYMQAEKLLDSDLVKAESLAKAALVAFKAQGKNKQLAKTYFLLGYIDDERNYLANAVIYYLEAIKIDADNYTKLSCLKNIGRIFKAYNRFEDAEKYYLEALDVAKRYHKEEEAGVLYNLGNLYKSAHNFDKANTAFLDAYTTSLDDKDQIRLANLTNQIGLVFKELKDYSAAREYYFRMINAKDQLRDAYPKYAGRAWHNIGITYLDEGNYQEAINSYLTSLTFKEKLGKDQFITWLDLGDAYLRIGQRADALKAFNNALSVMDVNENDPDRFIIYKLLAYANDDNLELYKNFSNRYATAWENYHLQTEQLTDLNQSYRFHITIEQYFQNQREQEQAQRWTMIVVALVAAFALTLVIIYLTMSRQKSQLEAKLKHGFND